ncbi:ABC transporter substrate-binding protein [Actinophytocola xinjiangensis]|uniref:ABC transporter substrate-binding protein n=1 Tax=Actinophytocola xinjiangensis TaxID=485602 RepID=UPI0009FE2E70|nr:ABC transporter substrate-binding protein [Actinophytocola xinjiangensis]
MSHRLLAALLALCVALTACSDGGADGQGAGDGVLRVGVSLDTDSYDPYLTIQAAAALLYPAYDTLTVMDEQAEVHPSLATAWEQTDATTWRLRLREDVVFHDDSPLTAEVVKKNFERGKTLDTSPYAALYSAMKTITAVDEHTVDIAFGSPYPSFPSDIASMPGAMVSGKALDAGTDLTTAMVGAGGWTYDAQASSKGSKVVYRAFDKYWDAEAVRADTVEYQIISDDNARFTAFQSGQVDIVGHLQPSQVKPAESAGAAVHAVPIELNVLGISDRTAKLVPALADERVREAMALLVDRDALNASAYSGGGDPDLGGFMPKSTKWHTDDLDDRYRKADVARAKELLTEAGYPNGFSLKIGSVDLVKQRLSALSQLMAEGGIDLQVTTVPPGTLAKQNRAGNFPVFYGTSRNVEPAGWYSTYVAEAGPYNAVFGATDMRDLDAKVVEASSTQDQDQAVALWNEVQTEVLDRGYLIPLMWTSQRSAISSSVDGEPVLRPSESTPRPHGLAASR